MKLTINNFIFRQHYDQLPRKHWSLWRFTTLTDNMVELERDSGIHAEFYDAKGKLWMVIDGKFITVKAGYAWNGCSPKRCVLGIWIGTPDTAKNTLASLIHDALCQFFSTVHFPFNKFEVDLIFHAIMEASGFLLADTYYYAVSTCGYYCTKHGEYSLAL